MRRFSEFAFPAGDESDASNDEWDVGADSTETTAAPANSELGSPEAGKCDDVSMLKKAISKGDTEAVKQLLDNGMDVETKLGFGWTPLMCAVSVADLNLAKLLLDRGASANFSKDHWTVLMASCTARSSEDKIAHCVELLLSRSADPNVTDGSDMTCLMLAAREGYSKVINLLVSHGAEINVQDCNGYTALSLAVQYGKEGAVLKLLQLGADKTIRTKSGKSPADLAELFKRRQIARIFASSSKHSAAQAYTSMEKTLSKLNTNSDNVLYKESTTKLDVLELLLHGLNLGHLMDIMTDNDITWSCLMTMEVEEFEKIGITDPEDQQKLLSAVHQIQQDNKIQLEAGDNGSEDLLNFLLSVNQQCCYLTEMIQDVISRFPRRTSQLVTPLDPKKEAQTICNQLMVQTKDLRKEVACLRNLLCQMDAAKDGCRLPQPGSKWRIWAVTRVGLGMLAASLLLLIIKH